MIFSKREHEVEKIIIEIFNCMKEVLDELGKLIDEYLKMDKNFKAEAYVIDQLEHKADILKRDVITLLSQGTYLPVYREEYINLVETADKIANRCEDIGDFIVLTRPQIPEFIVDEIKKMLSLTNESYAIMLELSKNYMKKKENVLDYSKKIREFEQSVDRLHWESTKKIFKSDMDLAHKLHIRELVERVSKITNRIEDTAAVYEKMAAMRRM